MRNRTKLTIGGTIGVIIMFLLADPDSGIIQKLPFGGGTIAMLLFLAKGVISSTLLFLVSKGMLDYAVADFEELGKKALQTPQSAAVYAVAIAITKLAFAIVIGAAFFA